MVEHMMDLINCSGDLQDAFLDNEISNYEATYKHLYMMPRLAE